MNFTLVERYIIESIAQENCSLEKLHKNTHLPVILLEQVTESLIQKNILCWQQEKLSIGKWPQSIDLKLELNDLASSMNDLYLEKKSLIHVRKFYCSAKQESMIRILIGNLLSYLKDLHYESGPIHQQKVLYLGLANHLDLVTQDLS